jgi:hypothetical protein
MADAFDQANQAFLTSAQSRVVGASDENPDDAARSIELGDKFGVPAPVVHLDQDGFVQQKKDELNAAIVKNNQYIQQYINSHPMAAAVSNDDLHNLDAASERFAHAGPFPTPVNRAIDHVISSAVEGFKEGSRHTYGEWMDNPNLADADWARAVQNNPVIRGLAYNLGLFAELPLAGISGVISGGIGAVEQAGREVGLGPGLGKEAATWADALMMGHGGEFHFPSDLHEAVKVAEPYVKANIDPPYGVHPLIDKLHEDQAKDDIKELDEDLKLATAAATRERAPKLFEEFERSLHGDATISINSGAVRQLYGDKQPHPEDGILGWVTNIDKQLSAAEQFGGRIEVSRAAWLANVDKEVAKTLKDDIAVRKGQPTANEIEAIKDLEPLAQKPNGNVVDSIRRMAGVEPVREAPLTLSRVVDDEAEPGTHTFDFNDEQGKRIGGGVVAESEDGKTLTIKQIAAGTAQGMPGVIGPAQVRNLLRQLQGEFPGAERISGLKAIGLPREGQEASVPLKDAVENPQLLTMPEGDSEWMRVGSGASEIALLLPTDKWTEKEAAVTKVLNDYLKTILPKLPDEQAIAARSLSYGGEQVHGLYIPQKDELPFIAYALYGEHGTFRAPEDLLSTVRHESVHLLKRYGFFSDEEWRMLVDASEREDWIKKHNIEKRYAGADYSLMMEESIADEFGDWNLKPESTHIAKDIFQKMRDFFLAMRDKIIQTLGWDPKVEDLFSKIESGEIGLRSATAGEAPELMAQAQREKQPELPGMTRMEDRKPFEKTLANVMFTSKGYQKYLENIAKLDQEDQALFKEQAEKLERARQTQEWKENLKRTKEEVRNDVMNRPDIATDNFLREGILWGDKQPGRPRLDADRLTAEQKKGIPEDYMKSGGVSPEDVATNFGYHGVDEMLNGLRQHLADRGERGPNEYIKQMVDAIANGRMEKEYGNLEENILAAAKEHVASDSQLDDLHEKMVALHDQFGGETELPITRKTLDSWVKKLFDSMPISMHSIDDYFAASGRSGKGVELALLDGNFREAFKFKQQQYISVAMAKEAKKYEKARASFDGLARRLAKPDLSGLLPSDYAAFARQMLQRANLKTGRTIQGLADDIAATGKDMLSWAQHESEMTQVPMMLSDLAYTEWKKPLDQMTHEEFKKFSTDVRTIYNAGRETKTIDTAYGKAALEDFIKDLKAQLAKQGDRNIPYNRSKVSELVGKARQLYYGGLVKAETVFHQFDLGDKRGIFNENFSYDAADASADFSTRIKKYAKKLEELDNYLGKTQLKESLPDLFVKPNDGLPVNMIRENAIKMVIDSGNRSNLEKMARGWMPDVDPQIALHRVWNWLAHNTKKEDWDFAQALGEIHEEIFRDSEAMLRSIGAPVPDRVALDEFTDPHGVKRKGWYSPIEYDPIQEGVSRKLQGLPSIDAVDPVGMMDTGYYSTTTPHGWEKRRTGYTAPTYLGLDRLAHRMQSVFYDTAMRPFVIKMGKVMRDPSFRRALESHAGVEVRNMLDEYLKDLIGANKGGSQTDIVFGHAIEFMRRNIVGQLIGWNIHTAEKHGLSALVTSAGDVGPINLAKSFADLTRTSPGEAKRNWSTNIEESEELQRRSQHWYETTGGQFEQVTLQRSKYKAWRDWIGQKGASIVAFADMLSANAVYAAERDHWMAKLAEENPGIDPDTYRGQAIRYANSAVRRAHGSTAITERPGIMRKGSFAHSFVSLFGFFNQMMQRLHEMEWRTEYAYKNFKEGDREAGAENLKRAAILFTTSVLAPALVEEWVTPYTNSDRESWGKWTAKTLISGLSATVPGIREFVHGWINNFETGSGILDSGWKTVGSNFSDIEKGAKMLNAQNGGKAIRDLNSIIGTITGVTNNEVGNIMKTIWDATHQSKETPKNAPEVYRDVTTGHAAGPTDLIQPPIEAITGTKGRRK